MTPQAFVLTPSQRREHMAPLPHSLGEALRCFFSYPSPRLLLVFAMAAVATRLSIAGIAFTEVWVVAAIVAGWPALEWTLHVVVLHWVPRRLGPWTLDPPVARAHRLHHYQPWRLEHVFIPYKTLVFSLALVVGLMLIVQPSRLGFTVLSAFAVLSLRYEWVHFVAHIPHRAHSRFGRALQKHHRRHHFSQPNRAFVVSSWPH